MALFVDGPASTIEDLTDQDSALLEVSQSNAVNLSTKLRLAAEEIRSDLELWLTKPRPTIWELWAPSMRIDQIVVNRDLKRWETMQTLVLVYRDVYFTQVVDRYQAKWKGYMELARIVRESFLEGGLPGVADPIHQAIPPALITTSGSGAAGTLYASVAWVNSRNQTGAASEAASMTVAAGQVMSVAAVNPPSNATGFLVYAGTALQSLVLQTPAPLPVTSAFAYQPGQITDGPGPSHGQTPDFVRVISRMIPRG